VGALVGETLAFLFLFRSYQFWDLSRTGLVRIGEPIFVLLWAYIVFGTLPGRNEWIGGSLILVGALWFGLLLKRR
jgi:drug/metabolite transporter (DMT)-like permease